MKRCGVYAYEDVDAYEEEDADVYECVDADVDVYGVCMVCTAGLSSPDFAGTRAMR